MTQHNFTISASSPAILPKKARTFSHLTYPERFIIQRNQRRPKHERLTQTQLAQILGKSKSTICREIRRGAIEQRNSDYSMSMRYHADVGQRRYEENRKRSKWEGVRAQASAFVEAVDWFILKDHRSPEQAVVMALKMLSTDTAFVCSKTIYNYIHQGKMRADLFALHLALRRKPSAAKQKMKKTTLDNTMPANRKSIEDRPDEINERLEAGHMEIDLILGFEGSKTGILSWDDRKLRKRYMTKTAGRTTEDIRIALRRLMDTMPKEERALIKSITCDNGMEFQRLAEDFPELTIYYAHPYSPGERGTNERQNGIVRYFIPKGRNMDEVSEKRVPEIAEWINTMPRKMFGWRSSNDMMNELLQRD